MLHTRQAFDNELQALQQELLEMASFVEQMINDAVESLARQDPALALQVIIRDDIVDELDIDIEQRCLRLLALQQPMASDLRIIGTAMKMITDIERVGDHSVDIAKAARKIMKESQPEMLVDIPRLSMMARAMLRESLQSFAKRDLDLVKKVCDEDDDVDRLYRELREQLHDIMRKNPDLVVQASWQLMIVHYLERVADHATNIAERVAFMETGRLEQLARTHRTDQSTGSALSESDE